MKHLKKIAALWAAAALSLPGSALAGFVWTESGPSGAGSLLPTAQTTYDSSFNALSGIQGFLTATVPIGGNPLYQVDLYKIRISDTAGFSARISDPLVDFGLFLFDATGMGVYMSEDGDGLNPLLTAGDPNGPLSTGVYYLAVATHGSIALDAGLASIFPGGGFGSPSGADPGAGALSDWMPTLTAFEETPYSYLVELTGATNGELPEPASLGLVLAAGLGAWAARRARKS